MIYCSSNSLCFRLENHVKDYIFCNKFYTENDCRSAVMIVNNSLILQGKKGTIKTDINKPLVPTLKSPHYHEEKNKCDQSTINVNFLKKYRQNCSIY